MVEILTTLGIASGAAGVLMLLVWLFMIRPRWVYNQARTLRIHSKTGVLQKWVAGGWVSFSSGEGV